MATERKQKLELTWIGKENRPRLEPRILLEDAEKSHHAAERHSDKDIFDNRLIFGDNLLALKALEQEFAGKVKCVFIDPPYNTGSAFTHYDDGVEHSIWLSLMRDRLELLRRLLTEDGSIWISLDDNEAHYLKVLGDEIFGRANFVVDIAWHKRVSPGNDAKYFSADYDHVFVFAKAKDRWKPNRLEKNAAQLDNYRNPDNDPRGAWNSAAYTCAKSAVERPNLYYPITNPNTGESIMPSATRVWAFGMETHLKNASEGLIYWGKDGKARMPRIKRFVGDTRPVVPRSIWPHTEAGHNQESKLEIEALFPGHPFATPKPERLLRRVVEIATKAGDLILDSFSGSGTTGAVAHKMGRRWIMIELGDHIHSHIIPRMKKVVDGADLGGITEATDWKGGGGFRYYKLAPSLLALDKFGNHIISKEYNAAMLAEAMCKLMGFRYEPSEELYWQQGRSTETDFLYTTTQTLSRQQLESLSEEVGKKRSLLVCCSAFRGKAGDFENLTLRKIPMAVLARCEWGKDDYSLNVANLPKAPEPKHSDLEPESESAHADRPPASPAEAKRRKAKAKAQESLDLFGAEGEVKA